LIVNLLLTILTLGIYSAWAKVRRLKYFYRHTELAGSGFDFHGNPIRILIGRVVALSMLLIYNFTLRLHSLWTIVAVIALALIMPWLLRNSLRFRLYNTSWRGARFHFRGSLAGAYRVFLLNGFLTLITLYGMAPFMHQQLKAYQHNNSWFGRTRFSFHAGVGKFYLAYLIILAAVVLVTIIFVVAGVGAIFPMLLTAQKQGSPQDLQAVGKLILIIWGTLVLIGVSIGPIFQATITNLIWNNTSVGEHRIECRMSALRLIWITASNMVLVAVTFGLFYPWALVRMTTFQLECITLLRTTDLQEIEAAEPGEVSAIGEEAATFFDFDISL
jgi:uncharacterized membrane protein YjgN (DUF898 family)